ncbi:hypothetical protein Y032_0038g3626 [Ancylostoma ceylanicum]|uniref:Rho-GAP domain-containing protein n=1 Tax=Ancylostoma ceylanicum TaxID=53326 RepID=A0A016UKT2_9BILA|nr:hypothetical protein Y032_0038g3626 [Ancylostoma ceylanicum]
MEVDSSFALQSEADDIDKGTPLLYLETATYLMRHLSRLCSYTSLTDMTAKNLAIVWAPNLFRAPPTLDGGDSHLLNGLDVHTSLCSYLITNSTSIFVDDSGDPVIISAGNNDENRASIELRTPTAEAPGALDKSATISDMRYNGEWRWSGILRGKSVEAFFKFGRHPSRNGSVGCSGSEGVEWIRSHSVEASLQSTRSDSIMSFMSRGVDELRGGIRLLRQRARSLRFSRSRPPPSPIIHLRHCSDSPFTNRDDRSSTRSAQVGTPAFLLSLRLQNVSGKLPCAK